MSLIKALGGGWEQSSIISLPATTTDPAARSQPEVQSKGLLTKFKGIFGRKSAAKP